MKRYFSGITAQQAPIPRAARHAPVLLPGTVHTASRNPHCTKLIESLISSTSSSRVMMVDEIDENRFVRSQRRIGWRAPKLEGERAVGRGACGTSVATAIVQRSVRAIRALYQFMNMLIER